jgi:hypothetical protein
VVSRIVPTKLDRSFQRSVELETGQCHHTEKRSNPKRTSHWAQETCWKGHCRERWYDEGKRLLGNPLCICGPIGGAHQETYIQFFRLVLLRNAQNDLELEVDLRNTLGRSEKILKDLEPDLSDGSRWPDDVIFLMGADYLEADTSLLNHAALIDQRTGREDRELRSTL